MTSDGEEPTAQHYNWHAQHSGGDAILIDAHDVGWCSECTYRIGVRAGESGVRYSLTAATDSAIVVLEDGVPHARTLGAGGDAHVFVLYVPPGGLADVKVTLTALSGSHVRRPSTLTTSRLRFSGAGILSEGADPSAAGLGAARLQQGA